MGRLICRRCGKLFPPLSRYCTWCGARRPPATVLAIRPLFISPVMGRQLTIAMPGSRTPLSCWAFWERNEPDTLVTAGFPAGLRLNGGHPPHTQLTITRFSTPVVTTVGES